MVRTGRIAAVIAALAAVAALALPAAAPAATSPVLGARDFAGPNGAGWGTVEPAEIFNGGDPSGLVAEIHWRSWGGTTAVGWGQNAIFRPYGGYYAHPVRIELRANGLGHCGARRAYTKLEVREPRRPGGPLGPWFSWSGAKTICQTPFG